MSSTLNGADDIVKKAVEYLNAEEINKLCGSSTIAQAVKCNSDKRREIVVAVYQKIRAENYENYVKKFVEIVFDLKKVFKSEQSAESIKKEIYTHINKINERLGLIDNNIAIIERAIRELSDAPQTLNVEFDNTTLHEVRGYISTINRCMEEVNRLLNDNN